jgi:hypothetical protein
MIRSKRQRVPNLHEALRAFLVLMLILVAGWILPFAIRLRFLMMLTGAK